MVPVPNCNLGVILGDFAVMAQSQGKTVYHSQTTKNFEYLLGQHSSQLQRHDIVNDVVTEITKFENSVCIRCKSSTKVMPTSDFEMTKYANNARFVFSLVKINEVSSMVGSSGVGASCKIYNSRAEYVLTNEPALRLFDGVNYGENLLENRIMHKVNQMQNAYTLHHDPNWGLLIWGRR
jgi:hypothetical protein